MAVAPAGKAERRRHQQWDEAPVPHRARGRREDQRLGPDRRRPAERKRKWGFCDSAWRKRAPARRYGAGPARRLVAPMCVGPEPDATCVPLGLQSSANTSSAWPGSVSFAFFGSAGSQSLIVESFDALTSRRESADHATWYTAPTWPVSVATNAPVRPCHSLTFLSKLALASSRPFGGTRGGSRAARGRRAARPASALLRRPQDDGEVVRRGRQPLGRRAPPPPAAARGASVAAARPRSCAPPRRVGAGVAAWRARRRARDRAAPARARAAHKCTRARARSRAWPASVRTS